MAIGTDISVAADGDIRYTGSTTNYTVIEFHRWLQDLADDASSSGDDLLDITDETPSERSTDNIITLYAPYNIDDTLAQHLYDGSIIQDGGDTFYDGIVNFGIAGIHIEVLQNGALVTPNFWGTGLNADANAGISHRFMVKTRTGGSDVDGRRLLGMNREFGFTYSEFSINGTARGNNVLALTHADDLNNNTVSGTVSGWTTISGVEGYIGIDVTGDLVDEYYYSRWTKDIYSINQFFERMKYLTRRGTSETLYGLQGDLFRGITHQVQINTPTGTFVEPELITWPTGTGQLLAIDSTTAGTYMWIQLLTGIAPVVTNALSGAGGGGAITDSSITERTLSNPFVGSSTGSAIIGSYGLGIEYADLTASDKLFDLDNAQKVPPNNVTFIVGGLESGQDRVLVGPEAGGILEEDQFQLAILLDADDEPTVTISGTIPSDTPAQGTIRVQDDNLIFRRIEYSARSGSDFTVSSTDGQEDFNGDEAQIGNNVFISYVDALYNGTITTDRFTGVYLTDRALFIRVRDGGGSPIKTFETTGTLGSSGGSTTAIRTSDA